MAVSGHLSKLKGGGCGTSFWYTFSARFFHKNIFYLTHSINGQSFNVMSLFLQKMSKKHVIKFLFRQLMISQTIRFMLDQSLNQWLTGRKTGEDGN